MSGVSTPLIRHHARGQNCGHEFIVHKFSDFEYGQRLGRTPDPCELGLVDTFNDPVFEEVGELVNEFLKPSGKEDWQRAKCFNLVFGITCDSSPSGYAYDFMGRIWCPVCGSPIEGYGPEASPRVEIIDLPRVTHDAWQQLSEAEKRERIRKALQKVGCLP